MTASMRKPETDPVASAKLTADLPSLGANVTGDIAVHPSMGAHALSVRPCPPLVPGETTLEFFVSAEVYAALGDSTGVITSINLCDIDGVIPSGGGNIAFVNHNLTLAGGKTPHAWGWLYDPRLTETPPDIDLGNGSGKYLGFHVTALGDWCVVNSAFFRAAPAGKATTIDSHSANLHDGKGFGSGF